ncbi:hypothetical protein Caka_0953 [Coraliomargarita akajimensis DSM 45221]|uniref:Uncharacterized protein n=1 Tax=Coraliomargarita akajimensis (strain DSM 45221 / IAM 15411 / JCM 23193 / KCTC 12865 / 04OKA010-24) TaxID=583355 RepID=D5EQY2_CORAD|nr:hypothetical protein Caka_0953 [Coraliomargarita akajimensis DSM 45221]
MPESKRTAGDSRGDNKQDPQPTNMQVKRNSFEGATSAYRQPTPYQH